MDYFLERFFEASRARWWQVLASICVGAIFGTMAAWDYGRTTTIAAGVKHAAPYAVGGGVLGLIAALVLLWVDAGQRMREANGQTRLTWRERFMVACLVLAFALAAFSCLCGALMGIVQAIDFISRL